MSKSERQLAVSSWQLAVRRSWRAALYCLLLTAYCLLFSGCRQDMQDQPRYEAYEASGFFKNGMASRPLVEGTIPRGFLKTDKLLFTGQNNTAQANANAANARGASGNANGNASGANSSTNSNSSNTQSGSNANMATGNANAQTGATASQATATQIAGDPTDADTFPFPVTQQVMERGQERYQIYCAMCHGFTGDGDGMIVRRGFRQPPSYHCDRLRQARVGHFFRVMTEGYGAMPSYKTQIPVQDRWAIVAYIRALQTSKMSQPPAPQCAETPAAANTQTGGQK